MKNGSRMMTMARYKNGGMLYVKQLICPVHISNQACFFNKEKISYVKQMLHVRGFHPEDGIDVLIDRSLMKIDKNNNCVRMHDLIQDMGREIVRRESTSKPGKRSRLWNDEDIVHVLENDMGSDRVEVIILHSSKRRVNWNGKAFKKMRNLKVLIFWDVHFSVGPDHLPNSLRVLEWDGYPSPSLPSDFHPTKLFMLNLCNSSLKLDNPLQACIISYYFTQSNMLIHLTILCIKISISCYEKISIKLIYNNN
ncbi:hypothetical protein HN51_009608 [Arachis hypogaea]